MVFMERWFLPRVDQSEDGLLPSTLAFAYLSDWLPPVILRCDRCPAFSCPSWTTYLTWSSASTPESSSCRLWRVVRLNGGMWVEIVARYQDVLQN
ncbi:hypothetical protein PR003_g16007 [Phytophthora rubi]|uniref:Uncharacterized protein n=1 Tax=Phytophthora rubi TaxID=129364 RepID=A0A6A3KHI4_9STRA|nr:hypothetical protein PR001_g17102 [Phytophthora rubi]KAE9327488.1 hypothetical protein PR003_g16007 [Phytophthora rubi]